MTLSLITFSEYSESYDVQVPQLTSSFTDRNQSITSNRRRPLSRFPLVRSVVHKINIGSEDSNLVIKSTSKTNISPQPNNFSNEKKFTYKNGRRIFISKANTSPNNISIKKSIKINPHLFQFNSDSDDESESYYSSYSYSQYYSETVQNDEIPTILNDQITTNTNNLPAINSSNDQKLDENVDKSDKLDLKTNDKNLITTITTKNSDIPIDSNQQLPAKEVLLDKYIVERKKNGLSIMGKSMKYILKSFNGSEYIPCLEAIVVGSKVSIIDTNSRKILGSIKAKKRYSHFLIRKNFNYCYDKVIMEIIYTSYNNIKPRSSFIKLYEPLFSPIIASSNTINNNTNDMQYINSNYEVEHNEDETKLNPISLHSRRPKRGTFGMWSLDFGSRRIISSIKNSIIVDDNNKEYLIIGKISENSLTVEVANGMDPIYALGIAVSNYMNTKP